MLALLLALAALAATGWLYQRDADERQMTEFRLQSAIQSQASALNRLQERLSDQRATAQANQRAQQEALTALRADQHALREQLIELSQSDRSDWRLAELEYLLKLARQRLLFGGAQATAVELLEEADRLVREIDYPGLLGVRTALANDLATLRALPVVDVEGLWLALEAVAGQIASLQLVKEAEQPEAPVQAPAAPDGWTARLASGLRAALAKLDQLVQIRRRDKPYQPMLAPQYEAALRQHLALLLEQAQLALLAGNQALYQRSLENAQEWLRTYFSVDAAATRAVVESIDALRQRAVAVDLPDIDASQRALRSFLQSRRKAPAASATEQETVEARP